jgi:hypothetical protein
MQFRSPTPLRYCHCHRGFRRSYAGYSKPGSQDKAGEDREISNGGGSMTPGVVGAATRAPHLPKDDANSGPLVSFARSGIATHWKASAYRSLLELAESCDVPVRWWGRSPTDRSHSTNPPMATFSFAVHNPFATSPLICELTAVRSLPPGPSWPTVGDLSLAQRRSNHENAPTALTSRFRHDLIEARVIDG